ncbi:1,6-anhydro-N-acetylmuramyl-L-alanine amidase AmpD [Gilvimarinus algae]|uniref:1,6-anhydro-N-acetylmuramyl-L-alanine amidase AmpD n=1 Tax=Gilvimarinus algae TaxID=3058037 RepID=UPI00351D66A4
MSFNSQAVSIERGWVSTARSCPSPNCGPRPEGALVSLLVIHNISLPPGHYGGGWIEQFFTNRLDPAAHPYFTEIVDLKVSSHLLVTREGELVQFVNLDDRAWHAGASCFEGVTECNDFSIGIELEGTDTEPYTDAQYRTLGEVSRAIMAQYPAVTAGRIAGHCDIAPGRKTDPGPAFDWSRYRQIINSEA